MAILSARNIVKTFGQTEVLKGVDLDVEKGDFLSIVGASGSGKSTLLTILGGMDRPTSGEVLLGNEVISSYDEKKLAILRRTKIGFVFQFFNLAPYLTAEENVMLPLILNGKNPKNFKTEIDDLAAYLGITDIMHKIPSKLSGGEQQRVAIARGLIFNPEIIFLDEPTGNLDSASAEGIMQLLSSLNKERGATVAQVTHSAQNAAYGNRIITIKDGVIVE